MYSGELEVQAKRKAIAVLQDEINRILNAARELATLPDLMMKKDKAGIKDTLEQISTIEEEVEKSKKKNHQRSSRCRRFDYEQRESS